MNKPNRNSQTKTPKASTRRVWASMKQRCNNPNNDSYYLYGGRGIKVCKRWEESSNNFLEDMGERPPGMTLDRIDPDGDYEPGNCRWVTNKENLANRRCSAKNQEKYFYAKKAALCPNCLKKFTPTSSE